MSARSRGSRGSRSVGAGNVKQRSVVHLPKVSEVTQLVGSINSTRPLTSTLLLGGSRAKHDLLLPAAARNLALGSSPKNSPFKPCYLCGREFGSMSLKIHEERCKREQLSLRTHHGPCRMGSHHKQEGTEDKEICLSAASGKVVLTLPARGQGSAKLALQRARPRVAKSKATQRSHSASLNEVCPVCGRWFAAQSISLHKRHCLQQMKAEKHTEHQPAADTKHYPPRPQTRTKSYSSLLASGHELPVIADGKCTTTVRGVTCDLCGQSVPSIRLSAHRRTCKPPKVSIGIITFPSSKQRRGAGQCPVASPTQPKTVRKPPSVVCYICGREYGTKSIEIHEPQCLRKWQIENNKLPIDQRRPLPTKPGGLDDDRKIRAQSTDERVEAYFQYCYAEFNRDLLPCSKCGRTFAPERHRKHVQNCNAKPLKHKI